MPKFAHEIIADKKKEYIELIKKYENSTELFNMAYEVEELLLDRDDMWFNAGEDSEAVYIWAVTNKKCKVSDLMDYIFDVIDPICEDNNWMMDTNRATKSGPKYQFYWKKDRKEISLEISTTASCKRVVVDKKLIEVIEYVCDEA